MPSTVSWLSGVLACACGAALGLIFTIAHRAHAEFFGTQLPVGFILGVVAVASLLIALRLLSPDRVAAVGAAIGVVGAIIMLAAQGDAGSVLITDGALGVAWLTVPSLIAAVVVVWPARRRPRVAE